MGILKNRSFVCIIIAAILCQVARNYLFVYMFLAKINHSELVVNSILFLCLGYHNVACLEADWHVHAHGIPLAWLRIAPTPMPKSSASLADLLENWRKLLLEHERGDRQWSGMKHYEWIIFCRHMVPFAYIYIAHTSWMFFLITHLQIDYWTRAWLFLAYCLSYPCYCPSDIPTMFPKAFINSARLPNILIVFG